MTLHLDTTHRYHGFRGCESRCRIRIYDPTPAGVPVVIATELDDNPGTSITNLAEQLAAEVLVRHLPHRDGAEPPLLWIEHYPPRRYVRDEHDYDLVRFAHWNPRWQRKPFGHVLEVGQPSWFPLSRAEVEALIGEPLPEADGGWLDRRQP